MDEKMKKIFALLIIATVLISIPLVAAANTKAPVSKIVFVHRVGDFAKPDGVGKPAKDVSEGYELLGKNVKWAALGLEYVINPTMGDAVISSEMINAITGAAETWDAEVEDTEVFDNTVITDVGAQLDTEMYDGVNEIIFGGIDEPNAIAMCVVWGRFVGPPSQREIIEFDIIFDCEDFQWGIVTETNTEVMDIQNIATHELGHALGLADLYADEWTEQTMYGYATEGETKKRTLDFGDITGITALYGE